jgi:hypothetical protein
VQYKVSYFLYCYTQCHPLSPFAEYRCTFRVVMESATFLL